MTLEIDVPASADTDELSIEPYRVSHFFRWPLAEAEDRRPVPTCWEDVACHPAWDLQSRATAMMLYTQEDGTSGACPGTLLNDSDPTTHIPYFLTAHHCVPDQVRASSFETYWQLSGTNR